MNEINLKDLPDISFERQEFKPVDEGDYVLKISSFEVRKSRTSGTPYINVGFTIAGPAAKGRKVWKNFFPYNQNEICVSNFQSFLRAAAGKRIDQFKADRDLPALLGRNVRARVTIETDPKGKERNNATYFAVAIDEYANAEYAPSNTQTDELPAL